MPQVGERRSGRTETVEWDGTRWTPVPHAATVTDGGYHPGLADSEHPGLAMLKGFLSGGATGLPTAARIAQFGLIPLLTGGASIPAQMAIGAGSQGVADLADRAAGDPNAPQDFGDFMTHAATGAVGPLVIGGGLKLLSKVPSAALAVASRMPGKIGMAAKAASAMRAAMPEAESAAASEFSPRIPRDINYSNRPGAVARDIPTASGWQEPRPVSMNAGAPVPASRAAGTGTSFSVLDEAPAAAGGTSTGWSMQAPAQSVQALEQGSAAAAPAAAEQAAPLTIKEMLAKGMDPSKIPVTAPIASEADYAARAASMAPRPMPVRAPSASVGTPPASAVATRAVSTAPAPVPTPRINASLAALEPAEQGIADAGLFRSGAGLPGQMTPSELKGMEAVGDGVYDAELGMVLPKTPKFDYEGSMNYVNDVPAPGPGVDLLYGNADVSEGAVSNLDDLLKIRRGGPSSLETLPNPADVPAALEILPASTRTPVSMQALGDDDGYAAFSKLVDDMAANTSDEQFAREAGTGASKRWGKKAYDRMGYTTPSRFAEIPR